MSVLNQMPADSRLWIYQADRALTEDEQRLVLDQATEFVSQWNSHGAAVKAAADMPNPYVLVFAVDNNFEAVSGCSIDSSVKVVRALGNQLQVDFFNRLQLLVQFDEALKIMHISELNDFTDKQLKVYDHSVKTLAELNNEWVKPIDEISWLSNWVS